MCIHAGQAEAILLWTGEANSGICVFVVICPRDSVKRACGGMPTERLYRGVFRRVLKLSY